ncbi:alpha/beta hydrolase family protein [Alkalicoccobacillus gibsonii]|uniref:alpha/beta hydrolase family protein n=1 Tax=Alkalicoccobacillus gibsonii TaxID=79881 RepID=UPI003F7B9E81
MKQFHDIYFEPYMVSVNNMDDPIFIEDQSIKTFNEHIINIDDEFIALISLKNSDQFIFMKYKNFENRLIVQRLDRNFSIEETNHYFVTELKKADILEVFMDTKEELIFIIITEGQTSNSCIILNEQDSYIIKKDFSYDAIETFCIETNRFITTEEKPGYGLSAKVINLETNDIVIHVDRYLCQYENYVVYAKYDKGIEKIYVLNFSLLKVEMELETDYPVIKACLLDKNTLVMTLNEKGIIHLQTITFDSERVILIKKETLDFNLEFHAQNFNKIMVKRTSLSGGVYWGVLDKSNLSFHLQTVAPADFIETSYHSYPTSHILFEPLNKDIKSVVISLHGGPESFEFDELRYNGLYRSLLAEGVAVCALNYNGSAYTHLREREKVWGNWKLVIDQIVKQSLHLQNKYKITNSNITLFGISFGATLALLSASQTKVPFEKIVSIAPLMNLEKHLEKVSEIELDWFNARFGQEEVRKFFNWNSFVPLINSSVYLIQGDHDSIVNFNDTFEAFQHAEDNNLDWYFYIEKGSDHVPESLEEKKVREQYLNEIFFNK